MFRLGNNALQYTNTGLVLSYYLDVANGCYVVSTYFLGEGGGAGGGGGGPLSGVLSSLCYVIQDMGEGGGTDD